MGSPSRNILAHIATVLDYSGHHNYCNQHVILTYNFTTYFNFKKNELHVIVSALCYRTIFNINIFKLEIIVSAVCPIYLLQLFNSKLI